MQTNENLSIDLQYSNQLISFLYMLGVLFLNKLKHTYYLNLSVAFFAGKQIKKLFKVNNKNTNLANWICSNLTTNIQKRNQMLFYC